ncbi:metal-dependent hydrolase [Sphingomonas sp. CJ20]
MIKAVAGDRFSFAVFGGAQVLMDIEPLVHMLRGDAVLHGFTHTSAGAFVVAVVATLVGRPTGTLVLRQVGLIDRPIRWSVAACSAFVGTYSHIGLDALMHGDMRPFWPFADGNPALAAVSIGLLHALCVGAGVLGGGAIVFRTLRDA